MFEQQQEQAMIHICSKYFGQLEFGKDLTCFDHKNEKTFASKKKE